MKMDRYRPVRFHIVHAAKPDTRSTNLKSPARCLVIASIDILRPKRYIEMCTPCIARAALAAVSSLQQRTPQSPSMSSPSLHRLKRLQAAAARLLACMLVLLSLSCNEELPPYNEPEVLLNATVEGEYWLSVDDHSLNFYVRMTNTFDETLEGKATLRGEVVAFFARDTTIRKTLPLGISNLISGDYTPDGTLRIDPGKSIVLKAVWRFNGNKVIDDGGRDLTFPGEDTAAFFSFVEDKTCEWRRFARPEDMILKATVTVYSGKAPVTAGPTVFPFCFVSNFVDVRVCPRVYTIPACRNWPQ